MVDRFELTWACVFAAVAIADIVVATFSSGAAAIVVYACAGVLTWFSGLAFGRSHL